MAFSYIGFILFSSLGNGKLLQSYDSYQWSTSVLCLPRMALTSSAAQLLNEEQVFMWCFCLYILHFIRGTNFIPIDFFYF